ncbi:MAG: hypothetical protein WCM76_12600 [Bacteroidota bacterium]
MHLIEPFYAWINLYSAAEDEHSPFHGKEYDEFHFTNKIYNHLIHPQWDEFGSLTLYLKILYADYSRAYCIIEMLGEWNDCLYNDIMFLKRDVIDVLMAAGINKFILIGENVLDFHFSDDSYYQEWFEEAEDGWIACVNFRKHVVEEFCKSNIDYYLAFGENLNDIGWRRLSPPAFFDKVSATMSRRLNP